jgi:TolA-binding protein
MTSIARMAAPIAFAAVLSGCGGGAQEMLDTAQLEETQHNVPHARQLYAEIVQRYPGTPQAETAQSRLRTLEQGGGGAATTP